MKASFLFIRQNSLRFFFSAFIGTVAFTAITGGLIFIPSHVEWLMIGDAAQHQIGWEFFRSTAILQWPLGLNPSLGMVFSSSIVFTDSIPIAALIFKFFSQFLGLRFQYFGIWIWLCFVLQFHFAHRILTKYSHKSVSNIIAALFLVISPPFLYRMVHQGYGHIALASQFLILAAFDLYLDKRTRNASWIILISLSVLIQAYFIPMIIPIWIANLIRNFFVQRSKLIQIVQQLTIGIFTIVVTAWVAGYFSIGTSLNPPGWNYVFRWQPLALIDSGTDSSLGWSYLIRDNAQLAGDNEAFSFLGSGILILMTATVIKEIYRSFKVWGQSNLRISVSLALLSIIYLATIGIFGFKLTISLSIFTALIYFVGLTLYRLRISRSEQIDSEYLPLFFCCLLLAAYSMTNQIGIGTHRLFTYPLFHGMRQFTETFRTHGRFVWPFFYGLTLLILVRTIRIFTGRKCALILFFALTFQITDSTHALNGIRDRFESPSPWTTRLQNPIWAHWANRYESILVAPPLNNDPDELWISIARFAADSGMSTNSGYFSRYNLNLYQTEYQQLRSSLLKGSVDKKYLYVVQDSELWNQLISEHFIDNSIMYFIDGLHVIAP